MLHYLIFDYRITMSGDYAAMETAIRLTALIDDFFGCSLNAGKCARGATHSTARAAGPHLATFPHCRVFKYMGVDIAMNGAARNAVRKTAKKSHDAVIRCGRLI